VERVYQNDGEVLLAGSTRVAMRTGYGSGTTGLLWLFERLNVGSLELWHVETCMFIRRGFI
jgi:hypothetical protein